MDAQWVGKRKVSNEADRFENWPALNEFAESGDDSENEIWKRVRSTT